MRILFATSLFCYTFAVCAQSIPLNGVVVIQNSQYETGQRVYVSDASIRAPLAKAAITDKQGIFALEFVGVPNGSPVRLSVKKPGLEVVNSWDIAQVILGRASQVQVVMADPRKLAEAQEKFYRIVIDAAEAGYLRKVAVLEQQNVPLSDRLSVFSGEREQQVGTLLDAIELLTAERQRAMDRASELARQMATTDLDNASDLFRRAYGAFQRGELDSSLSLLNKERLDADYASARAHREKGGALIVQANEAIRQVYQSHGLKADVLKTTLDYRGALAVLDRMGALLQADKDAFEADAEYELALKRGMVLDYLVRYADAVAEYRKGRALTRKHLGDKNTVQVRLMGQCAWSLILSDSLDQATDLLEEALALMRGQELEEPLKVADLETALGTSLTHSGDPAGAKAHLEKALELRRANLPPHHPDIIHALNGVAIGHGELGEYQEAVAIYLEMDELARSGGEPLNGFMLSSMGKAYMELGDLDKAASMLRSGRSLQVKEYGPRHPEVFLSYLNLSTCLWHQGKREDALALMDSALALNSLPEDHRFMGSFFHQKGYFLHESGAYEEALTAYERSLAIKQKLFGEMHQGVAITRSNIADLKQTLGDPEGALREDSLVFVIRESVYGPENPLTWATGCRGAVRLVGLERDSAALEMFGRYLPRLKEKVGYEDHGQTGISVVTFENWLGLVLYRQGELDSARAVFEGTAEVKPHGGVERYLSEIAMAQGRDNDALTHALRRARLLGPNASNKDRTNVMEALRTIAIRLDRQDVLQEFKEYYEEDRRSK